MPVTVIEKWDSRRTIAGDNPRHERLYVAIGSDNEQEIYDAVVADAPALYEGIPLRSIDIEPQYIDTTDAAGCRWDCTAAWNLAAGSPPPQAGDSAFSFDTGGGTQHITHSRFTAGTFVPSDPPGQVAPDYQGAIGVSDSGVAGVDVDVPSYQFSETHWLPPSFVTLQYRAILIHLRARVNLFDFKGLDPGECLFLGASGSRRGTGINDPWEITFRFAGSPNAIVSVGPIQNIWKFGWQYLWVRYAETEDEDAQQLVTRPIAAYVEEVYQWGDFGLLGIGV
jgi:hypothetical protein